MEDLALRLEVATKVLDYKLLPDGSIQEPDENNEGYGVTVFLDASELPDWEDDWRCASIVIDRMAALGWSLKLITGADDQAQLPCDSYAEFTVCGAIPYDAQADTAPEAICRAAVAAVSASTEATK